MPVGVIDFSSDPLVTVTYRQTPLLYVAQFEWGLTIYPPGKKQTRPLLCLRIEPSDRTYLCVGGFLC